MDTEAAQMQRESRANGCNGNSGQRMQREARTKKRNLNRVWNDITKVCIRIEEANDVDFHDETDNGFRNEIRD